MRPHAYGLLEDYTGHGIGTAMHEPPNVPNYGRAGRGPKLVPGHRAGGRADGDARAPGTDELDDGWTVVTRDGRQAAHWEHTVAVTPEGPWVLTAQDGGAAGLGARSESVPARRRRATHRPSSPGARVGVRRAPGVQWPLAFASSVGLLWPQEAGRPLRDRPHHRIQCCSQR